MQPSDLGRLVTVSQPTLAPDGEQVAFVVTHVDAANDRYRSAIWLVPVDGSRPARPLTDGPRLDHDPVWAPDGSHLAYSRSTADEPPMHELVILPVDGPGEPVVLDRGPEAHAELAWSPGGDAIAGVVRVRTGGTHKDDRRRPARQIVNLRSRLDDAGWTVDRRRQIFVVATDGLTPLRCITSGPYEHRSPCWSPNGDRLAFVAARHDDWDVRLASDLFVVDPSAADAALTPLTDTTLDLQRPAWSPDGERLALIANDERSMPEPHQIAVIDIETGRLTVLTDALDRACLATSGATTPVWTDDGRSVLFTCDDGGDVPLRQATLDGDGKVIIGDRWVVDFDARGDVIVFVGSRHDEPVELYALVGDTERQLTDVQSAFVATCPPLAVERITVPSPAGDVDLDVWLARPSGFDASRRYPALLTVHGGPQSQYGNRWFDEMQLFASAGYVVVFTNPHGSTGKSRAFLRAIRAPMAAIDPGTGWGGIDYQDVLAALDGAIAHEPAIDPDRVGIIGGSYGGYMASWAIGHTNRFTAAVSERAVNNIWTLEWTSDMAGLFRNEFGIDPWDDRAELERESPITYVADIETPVLILHSENDLRCPVEQADQLFTQLRLLGKPVEYWRFPGEGHELSRSGSPSHRVQRAEIILDFFARHLPP